MRGEERKGHEMRERREEKSREVELMGPENSEEGGGRVGVGF